MVLSGGVNRTVADTIWEGFKFFQGFLPLKTAIADTMAATDSIHINDIIIVLFFIIILRLKIICMIFCLLKTFTHYKYISTDYFSMGT